MPKVKTNSGAKKRFALTGSGKIKRKQGEGDKGSVKISTFAENFLHEMEELTKY
jgi:hypothetical protein